MKILAQLKAECSALGLTIPENRGRASKEPYIAALRNWLTVTDFGGRFMPPLQNQATRSFPVAWRNPGNGMRPIRTVVG